VTKTYRQAQILKLIRGHSIRTQEDLSEALGRVGIDVTQVTLSRDMRELGLVKGPQGYQEPVQAAQSRPEPGTLKHAVEEYMREVRTANSLVIIKTVRGAAAPIADALDHESWPEVVGTIAGEDTIFVAAPDARRAQRIQEKLLELLR
jgi:transcriptional regulator of arginine metabolism